MYQFPWSIILDKTQTKELTTALKLILIGILFWVIRVRYFTFFLVNNQNSFLNVLGLEIIGTVIVLIGIFMIHRIYPFPQTNIAIVLCFLILSINVLDFFLFRYEVYIEIRKYLPFVISLVLIVVAKLLEVGLRYFGNLELSKKWHSLSAVIFFGFSAPYYIYISLRICGFLTYEHFTFSTKIILLFLPVVLFIFSIVLYYILILLSTFKFLLKIRMQDQE